jgi:colanic acid biosynthesis glycosyl transferase WcaI
VVIAAVPPATVAWIGRFVAGLRRVPLVLLLRDVEPHMSLALRGYDQTRWGRWLAARALDVYRQAQCIVVVDPAQAELLASLGLPPQRIHTLVHAVDLERFRSEAMTHPVNLPRRNGRRIALFAGTFGVVHRLPELIDLFADPAVRRLPFDLVLVGAGECTAACRQRIAARSLDNVLLLPPVSLEAVPAMLCAADLLICSHEIDVRGIKLPSYFAAGKPVLAHGLSGAARLIARLGAGWTVRRGDAAALAEALAACAADPVAAAARGRRGRLYAEEHLSLAKQLSGWRELLDRVICQPFSKPPSTR